ncbi:MAG: DUF4190 domain-containing protein [Thermoanaerobaculia bacterium]
MSEPMSDVSSTGGDTAGSATGTGGAGTSSGAKGSATLILVFGILGIVCCPILAPVAWFMANQELKGIAQGHIQASNEGTAKAGMILGIIGTVFLALWLVWVFLAGGLAFIGALAEA